MKRFLEYLIESNIITEQPESALFAAVETLQKFLKSKKFVDDFKRAFSMINLVDNQAGVQNEKLLTYLINKHGQSFGIQADNVGKNQELTDIIVKTSTEKINISLKTTAATEAISLGMSNDNIQSISDPKIRGFLARYKDQINSTELTINDFDEKMADIIQSTKNTTDRTGSAGMSSIDVQLKDLEKIKDVKTTIKNKIDIIVDKICGPQNNKEVFMWAEKVYDKKMLSTIVFHVYRFDPKKLREFFNQCSIYVVKTNKGYFGLKYHDVNTQKSFPVIRAKGTVAILNIDPKFMRACAQYGTQAVKDEATSKPIEINILEPLNTQNSTTVAELQQKFKKLQDDSELFPQYFEALIQMYDNIMSTNTTTN